MIHITEKHDCCGCSACVQRCPKHCIFLEEDNEGFLYPHIDATLCINCGLCEKVCPIINSLEKLPVKKVLAVKNRNEAERMASSSGGVFIALAKQTIAKDGVVFGAVFDENWEVMHTYAETLEEIKPMMGSKYLQSRIGNSFRNVEKFLKEGRKVLFTGSPCQIAGLHNYLRKDYPNLLSVDFLCHGVPSPGVWRKYLDEEFNLSARREATEKDTVLSSYFNSVPVITRIEFRDKTLNGWKKYNFIVRGKSSAKADHNSVLLSDMHSDNPFMRGFLSDVYLRPSCYRCKCKNGVSHSDLTIGDFWGIEQLMPDFDDDKGIGLVLINTDKGQNVFGSLDMETRTSSLEKATCLNGGFNETVAEHVKRNYFFDRYRQNTNICRLIKRTVRTPLYKRIIRRMRRELLLLIGKF